MKKVLLIFSALTLLFACGEAEKGKEEKVIAANSDWKLDHLKGMVESIEVTNFTADSTGIIGEMDSCCTEVTNFNDEGYVEKYSELEEGGTVSLALTIERDAAGRFLSNVRMKDGKPDGGIKVTRDDNGKILKAETTDSTGGKSNYHTDIQQNDIGQAIKGKMFQADGVYLGTWTIDRTEGMETGRSWTDTTGTLLSESIGEVNDNGWLAKQTKKKMDPDGEMTTTVTTYTYDAMDDAGNWTKRSEFEDGKLVKVEKRILTYFEEEMEEEE